MKISHWLVVASFIAPLLACSASTNEGTNSTGKGGSGGGVVTGGTGGTNNGGTGGTNNGGTGGSNNGGSSGGSGGSGGSAQGGSTGQCGLQTGVAACDTCMNNSCLNECNSFMGAKDTSAYISCAKQCQDDACFNQCGTTYPEAAAAYKGLNDCLGSNCKDECGGGGCGLQLQDPQMDACMKDKCEGECAEATSANGASDYLSCIQACNDDDESCFTNCSKTYPEAATAMKKLNYCLLGKCGDPNKCGMLRPGACADCVDTNCLNECKKCLGNFECMELLDCSFNCAQNDDACQQQCAKDHPDGVNDLMDFLGSNGCLSAHCESECGAGSGGSAGSGGN